MTDTELYIAHRSSRDGNPVVLKLARIPAASSLASLAHEANVLDQLGGSIAPALIDAGTIDRLEYIVMEWRRGVDAGRAAAGARTSPAQTARAELERLAVNIAEAYAELHRRGVIHGDVHDRNVIVDRDGRVTLLDFGLARFVDGRDSATVRRGGHSFYYEPEFARASINGARVPPASLKSDQYSLGAMLYQLLTGSSYIDFELDEPRAFAQIINAPMVPFARRGAAPWPTIEPVLSRALAKAPQDRFDSTDAFARAIRDAGVCRSNAVANRANRKIRNRRLQVVRRTLERLSRPGVSAEALPPPTASVAFGAAGIGLAFCRLAQLRDDATLLAVADQWCQVARAERRRARALYDGGDLVAGTFGRRTFYYGLSGLDVVEALVAVAQGDFMSLRAATRRLATLPAGTGSRLDCVLGLPGTLIGLSQVLDALPEHELVDPSTIVRAGTACARAIADGLARQGPIAEARKFVNLGIAHGWAGATYSLMRWHQASGLAMSSQVRRRLTELAALAEPTDRGLRWAWRDIVADSSAPAHHMPGWCNGSAGFVHLWVLAHTLFGGAKYLTLAEGAAWDAYDDGEDTVYDLCCGRAGRAYALLALYRSGGDDAWLSRGRQLAETALDLLASASDPPPGLIKGAMGVVLLDAELEQPHKARMPGFESVGWPTSSRRKVLQ
jgi:serine/threonine-protein kinase